MGRISKRSWILALVGLGLGVIEMALDVNEPWVAGHAPVLHHVVEFIEMALMVPGIAVALFFISEWRAATQRRYAEALDAEREQRFATLGRLAACVAHEVRNPLHNLNLLHEALEDGGDGPGRERLLGRVADNLHRIDAAIERIYDLARPAVADEEGDGPFDCRKLLASIRDELAPLAGVPIVLEADAGPVVVHGPATAVHIVLHNLVRNAVQATERTPADGVTAHEVRLAAEAIAGRVRITVRNPGHLEPDITRAGKAKEADAATPSRPNGLGLGLMIVRQILERIGADFRLEQEGPGRVRATVDLPDAEGSP